MKPACPKPGSFFLLLAAALFLLRLFYGLCKFAGEDEFQVYLIGLKYYTTGLFPHWGADTTLARSQLPGGLLGWLVGAPFFVAAVPEAPHVLLNGLSFAALLLWGWYLGRRVPGVPAWFRWGWLFTSPWTLHYSTHVENPSYVLLPAVLFFVAAFELWPVYDGRRVWPPWVAFACLGLAIGWIFQIHLSYVLLLPLTAAVFYARRHERRLVVGGLALVAAGAALPLLAFWPNAAAYGWAWTQTTGKSVLFRAENLLNLFDIAAKFMSLASYEVPRFLGHDTPDRLAFVGRHAWAAPVIVFLLVVGLAQAGWLLVSLFRRNPAAEWPRVRGITAVVLLLVYGSYLFAAVSRPAAHAFFLVWPVVVWYSFYVYAPLFARRWFRRLAAVVLLGGAVFQTVLTIDRLPHYSLFAHRARIVEALDRRDYTLLGVRRQSRFEEQHGEDPWVRQSGPAGERVFKTAFEYKNPYFRPQNIVRAPGGCAGYVCKLDSLQPFGGQLQPLPLTDVAGYKTVRLTANVHGNAALAVLQIRDVAAGKTVHWQSAPLSAPTVGVWRRLTAEFALPDSCAAPGELSLYFWKPDTNTESVYLDSVEVRFSIYL